MALVAKFFFVQHKGEKAQDEQHSDYSIKPVKRRKSLLVNGDTLKNAFMPKQDRGHWVPTISGIIKAGDEGIYTSTLFSDAQGLPGPLPLETLHEAFANELRGRPSSERSSYPSEISKFLLATKREMRRSVSVRVNKRRDSGGVGIPELSPRPHRKSIDPNELGLGRAISKRVTPVLISLYNKDTAGDTPRDPRRWADDVEHSLLIEGKPAIIVTAKELAALSIVLGTTARIVASWTGERTDDPQQIELSDKSTKGAHGISISGTATKNGEYRLSLSRHRQRTAQLPALGSGYSILLAKHLACGSLPFLIDGTVNSVLITKETLLALKSGSPLHLAKTTEKSPASAFLFSIPNAKPPTFHTLNPSAHPTPQIPQTLLTAVASLPFSGGLTPLATPALIQTISFIASGGLVPGRLLQRLDALVEKTHRQAPHLHLFGPLLEDQNAGLLYREHEKLGKLATGALKSSDESLPDKVARVRRYVTLVERLMCLVPGMRPSDVLAAVRKEVRAQIEQSYLDALAASSAHPPQSPSPSPAAKRNSQYSAGTQRSKQSRYSLPARLPAPLGANPPSPASSVASTPFSRTSNTFPAHNLGTVVEGILKAKFPLDVRGVATVVRFVLVAWTLSVGSVKWEEGEEGVELWKGDEVKGVERMVLV